MKGIERRKIEMKNYLVYLLLLISCVGLGQKPKNCPAYPTISYFDTTCYLYVDEIKLGQGRISHPAMIGSAPKDIHIPMNKSDQILMG